MTGLTNASTGLRIAAIGDNEATTTAYTVAGSTIDTIATLGTYAAPTGTHCRFAELDATSHKGIYEVQLENSRFAVSSAKSLLVSLSGATNLAECDVVIPLRAVNPYDGVHGGMSALPNTACTTNASLLTSGTGTDQIANSAGKVLLQATQSGVTISTVTTVTNQLTAAAIATGVWQDTTSGDFTVSASIGKSLFTSGAVPGAAGGLFIAGTNAATSITTGLTAHIIGTVDTVTTVTNQLTAAAIATGVWQDATAGDFTTASSIGKSLFTGNHAPGAASGLSLVGSQMDLVNAPNATAITAIQSGLATPTNITAGTITTVTNQLTAAAIAAGVWRDAVAGDFAVAGSIGLSLGGAFSSLGSSVFTVAALANAPTGGSAPTTAQIATAVWEDTTSGGDFGTAGSIGKLIATTGLTIAGVSGVTFPATVASPTNITAGTIANLTNAPTAGDFTATMKTSLNSSTPGLPASAPATFLDAITASDPGAVATTFPQMLVQLWRRMFKKTTLTATQLKTYDDTGAIVRTTQTVSDDGTTQVQGAGS